MLQDIPNTICYLDDILVTWKSDDEHLRNLEEVLKRLSSSGLKLKKSNWSLMKESVQYLGHRIGAQEVHTTPDKTTGIQRAPTPQNVKQFYCF